MKDSENPRKMFHKLYLFLADSNKHKQNVCHPIDSLHIPIITQDTAHFSR